MQPSQCCTSNLNLSAKLCYSPFIGSIYGNIFVSRRHDHHPNRLFVFTLQLDVAWPANEVPPIGFANRSIPKKLLKDVCVDLR